MWMDGRTGHDEVNSRSSLSCEGARNGSELRDANSIESLHSLSFYRKQEMTCLRQSLMFGRKSGLTDSLPSFNRPLKALKTSDKCYIL